MNSSPARVRRTLLTGITRNVVVLGLVSLLTDVSSELLVFLIPLFLANVLSATPAIVGIVEGITESAAAFLRLGSGWLSDRVGRRKVLVVAGYSTSTVAKAVYLVAGAWPVVLLARLGDRVGKGIRTAPRDALIADSTAPEARGRAFGFHRAMDTAGATAGVAIAAAAVGVMQGDAPLLLGETWRVIVLLALVPAIVAIVVGAVGIRDVRRVAQSTPVNVTQVTPAGSTTQATPAGPATRATPAGPATRAPLRDLPAAYWWYLLAVAIFTLGNSSDAFLALRSQALGVAVRDLLLILVAFNAVGTLVAWPLGTLSDRVGRHRLIAVGWALYGLAYLGFAVAAPGSPVLVLWLVYGAYYGIAEAVGRALVADLVPTARRGTAYGILGGVTGLSLLPASVIGGLLWETNGPAAPFWFGAGCALTAAAVLMGPGRRARRPLPVPGAE